MGYLFTSESVSEGHPDKVADQISDALLDEFLRQDKNSKVAIETFVTTGLVIVGGEVRTEAWVDIMEVVRRKIREIGYTKPEYRFDAESCGVLNAIHEQSPDIFQGVERGDPYQQGAGDQGMMFGYACTEMDNFMPMPIELAHLLVQRLADIRREKKEMTYLRPDSKSQVTIEYANDGTPLKIDTIVLSTQHDEFIQPEDDSQEARKAADRKMQMTIEQDIRNILIPRIRKELPERVSRLFDGDFKLLVNPTGKFVIGGPHGDTGLTGRKIIVDTYGGRGAHGGGAFSGKDPSKVDRSAAYAMRHIAKNLVAAGVCSEVLVQVAYAIGVAEPVGLFVNTFGTCKARNSKGKIFTDAEVADIILKTYDLRPYAIIRRLGLLNPVYAPTARYGHFGRDPYTEVVEVAYQDDHTWTKVDKMGKEHHYKNVEFFAWEKLDYVDKFREVFNLKD